ncbi:hypothetical protein [Rhodoferax sp. GW822-FHT02A01]|uniref:hypothetical protein n=1 Tax=Rhodoferax sp. GW822-FHT02A01 TaxID=3141537 RepID=UPI00315D62F3
MLTHSQINAVLTYAETVIAINPDAEQDIELLLERLDNEFNIEHMPTGHFQQVADAVASNFFHGQKLVLPVTTAHGSSQ